MQLGYTKFCCLLREWDSRERKYYHFQNSGIEENRLFRYQNVVNSSLFNPDKVYLPPFHTKLGLIKNFVNEIALRI
jgi:hypothetical protein